MSTDETNIRCTICRETVPQGYLLCPFCGADLTTTYETKVFAPVTTKDVGRRIRLLLTKPRDIFEEIADNPDSRGGVIFLFAISFCFSIQVLAYLAHIDILDNLTGFLVFIVVWILASIIPFISWFLASWVIRLTTKLLGGKAKGKQIRAAVGYGLMPIMFAEILAAFFLLVALPTYAPDVGDFYGVIDAMLAMRNSFAGIFAMVLHFLGIIVGAVFMVFIIKPASEFSWVETAFATGIPIVLFIILLITYYVTT